MLDQIQEHIKAGHDFAIETTLADRSYVRLLKDLKKKGYKIHLFYLWLHKPDLALKRIAERVRAGRARCAAGGGKTRVCQKYVQFLSSLQTVARFMDAVR